MAILNVTPDSFSDGGLFYDTSRAVDAAMQMVEDGADLVDVGGESTRPGAESVAVGEELRRVIPVIEALARLGVRISIDTSKAEVAKAAIQCGAVLVNDVTALSDPEMAEVCAAAATDVCLMHMKGSPRTMQVSPSYDNVVAEVKAFLNQRVDFARSNGIAEERIILDPGIGFGKTSAHNLALIRAIPEFVRTGHRILIGVSRKSFIGQVLQGSGGPLPPSERLEGTLAVQVLAQAWGANYLRCHDVKAARRAITMTDVVLNQ